MQQCICAIRAIAPAVLHCKVLSAYVCEEHCCRYGPLQGVADDGRTTDEGCPGRQCPAPMRPLTSAMQGWQRTHACRGEPSVSCFAARASSAIFFFICRMTTLRTSPRSWLRLRMPSSHGYHRLPKARPSPQPPPAPLPPCHVAAGLCALGVRRPDCSLQPRRVEESVSPGAPCRSKMQRAALGGIGPSAKRPPAC